MGLCVSFEQRDPNVGAFRNSCYRDYDVKIGKITSAKCISWRGTFCRHADRTDQILEHKLNHMAVQTLAIFLASCLECKMGVFLPLHTNTQQRAPLPKQLRAPLLVEQYRHLTALKHSKAPGNLNSVNRLQSSNMVRDTVPSLTGHRSTKACHLG